MSKKQEYLFYAIILGLLTMTGTVAVDLFVPAIPSISSDFNIGIGSIELSLAALFIWKWHRTNNLWLYLGSFWPKTSDIS